MSYINCRTIPGRSGGRFNRMIIQDPVSGAERLLPENNRSKRSKKGGKNPIRGGKPPV